MVFQHSREVTWRVQKEGACQPSFPCSGVRVLLVGMDARQAGSTLAMLRSEQRRLLVGMEVRQVWEVEE